MKNTNSHLAFVRARCSFKCLSATVMPAFTYSEMVYDENMSGIFTL